MGWIQKVRQGSQQVYEKVEVFLLLIAIPAGFLIWAYSNFATAKEMSDAKNELRAYVDQRHDDVKGDLIDIKDELKAQRGLQERILLRVRR